MARRLSLRTVQNASEFHGKYEGSAFYVKGKLNLVVSYEDDGPEPFYTEVMIRGLGDSIPEDYVLVLNRKRPNQARDFVLIKMTEDEDPGFPM